MLWGADAPDKQMDAVENRLPEQRMSPTGSMDVGSRRTRQADVAGATLEQTDQISRIHGAIHAGSTPSSAPKRELRVYLKRNNRIRKFFKRTWQHYKRAYRAVTR